MYVWTFGRDEKGEVERRGEKGERSSSLYDTSGADDARDG